MTKIEISDQKFKLITDKEEVDISKEDVETLLVSAEKALQDFYYKNVLAGTPDRIELRRLMDGIFETKEDAMDWFLAPSFVFNFATPKSLVDSGEVRAVINALGRMAHGIGV